MSDTGAAPDSASGEVVEAEAAAAETAASAPPGGRSRRRATDTADPTDGIGRRMAGYRLARGLRVSDLARRIGVSPSLVSQIERGQSRPSVSTLFAIAEALEVPVDALFRELPAPPAPAAATPAGPGERYVVRRADRAVIDIDGGVRWERLTPGEQRDVEFLELVYDPGAESNAALHRHRGEEMILILSGELDVYVGFERYRLQPGDSMHFPSMQPHRFVNPTAGTTRAVTTILHTAEWYATVAGQPH